MSSYVYMKVLESSPHRYDRGIRWLSGGAITEVYRRVAAEVCGAGRRVLDVGCGTGSLALACAEGGARVIGVDRDAGMLDVARSKTPPGASVEWVELGALELEDRFAPGAFDAAVSCLVFSELMPEEQDYVLRTLRTRVRAGGRVVVADEVAPRGGAARAWWRLRRAPVEALTWLITQTSTRPVTGLRERFEQAGFVNVRVAALHGDFEIVSGEVPEVSDAPVVA